jgi:hypothetical protein
MLLGSVVACASVDPIVIRSMGSLRAGSEGRFGETISCGRGLRQRRHHECVADRRYARGPDVAAPGLEPA